MLNAESIDYVLIPDWYNYSNVHNNDTARSFDTNLTVYRNIYRNTSDNESLTYSGSDVDLPFGTEKVYWALLLLPLPIAAVVGNILVILSVYKERTLQTVTNYFIVSLAFADLLVAAVVMPFAVYVLVNVDWELSDTLCDFYIALDVTCSTASIFNLVAISIDRFIAVTQPIKYSKHKNNKRVFLTIAIVWLVSAAIGSPIVLGLNTSPERTPQLCVFYNSDFIIYSSLSSFYIPCLVMIFLYYRIFKAIHARAKKSARRAAASNSAARSTTSGLVIENIAATAQRTKGNSGSSSGHLAVIVDTDAITVNTGSGSPADDDDEDDEETEGASGSTPYVLPNGGGNCHVIKNKQAALCHLSAKNRHSASALLLSAVVNETIRIDIPINGNTDSGYVTSQIEQETPFVNTQGKDVSPKISFGSRATTPILAGKKNGVSKTNSKQDDKGDGSVPVKKKSRFNLGRKHKSSRKKREKASAKKERKATKTLAIVLGMFLICWVPFFTCNILDAICIKLETDTFRPGMTAFLLTTWLGYINSCFNPVIYTIFNMEFRKAFKKLLEQYCSCCFHDI